MTNVEFVTIEREDGSKFEKVIIDNGAAGFTQMPKELYDAQVEHLTEIVPGK